MMICLVAVDLCCCCCCCFVVSLFSLFISVFVLMCRAFFIWLCCFVFVVVLILPLLSFVLLF